MFELAQEGKSCSC